MGVDALDEDELEPMGAIMRLVSAACVTSITQGRWSPKPIAEAILALQASSFAAGLAAPDPAPLDVDLREAAEWALAFIADPEGLAAEKTRVQARLRAALATPAPLDPDGLPAIDTDPAPLDVERLLPFLRHTNYCVLRNVRDNAPWDEACDCGLAALVHEPEPKSRVAE